MYYRGGGGGVQYGGDSYYGRESSGRGAFRAHEEEKRKQQQTKMVLAGIGGCVVLGLVVLVWVLSHSRAIPDTYVGECRNACAGADYLCGTICDKAMVGPFAKDELREACRRGCGRYGETSCRSACASNDISACQGEMKSRSASEFCTEEPVSGSASHSMRKACEIGAGAVSTTQWPCSVGVKNIGRILSEHKM